MWILKKAKIIFSEEGLGISLKKAGSQLSKTIISSFYIINKAEQARDIPKLISIPVSDIEWISTLPYHNFPHTDKYAENCIFFSRPIVGVVGGPWDKYKIKRSDTILYKSIIKRFLEGLPWSRTEVYMQARGRIEKGGTGWGTIATIETLEEKCRQVDSLFASMKQNGFLAQRPGKIHILGEAFPDECRAGIGRNGEVIRLSGGHHRISIAKLLGIKQVPVIIVLRHRKRQKK